MNEANPAMAELLFFSEALLLSFVLTGAVLRYSSQRRLLDVPNDRSSHRIPKPRLGGVAITLTFYLCAATLLLVGTDPFPDARVAAGTLAAGAFIALVGLADDLRGLDARAKLLAQIAAAAAVVASGVVLERLDLPLIGPIELGAMRIPFTLLWIVGFINVYNFIDGIDGLAAGSGMIAALFLIMVGAVAGAGELGPLYAILAGSLLGFLRYNFPPARIFMGDAGSTFIGFLFAALSVVGAGAGVPAFVTLLLLGGLVADVALTLIRRALRRERLLVPHRTHYYQRFTSLGLSHKQVTLLEYLAAVLLGASTLFYFRGERLFVTFFSLVWIVFFLWVLVKVRKMEQGGRPFWEGRTLAVALGDVVFIGASYVLSYYMRLNFRFPAAETGSLMISLPIVLVIRTAIFWYFGLYRSVWRYTSLDDLMRIVKAVSLSSLVMIVSFTLLFRFEAFPRSVFIIDWFVLIVFLAGARIATRWFHELPAHEESAGKRVAIGGTGYSAEALIHHLKKSGAAAPVGVIDDRAEMAGKVVHGLTVLGPFSDLPRLARIHGIEEVLLLEPYRDRFPEERREELAAAGVSVLVCDPATFAEPRSPSIRCGGRAVLVAGNGPLIEEAPLECPDASPLVIASNDAVVLESAARRMGRLRDGVFLYLGVLDEAGTLEGVFQRHSPEIVIADFFCPGDRLSNPLEGYVRSVLAPLDRLAAIASRTAAARFIALHRAGSAAGGAPERLHRASMCLLRWHFRRDAGRLAVVEGAAAAGREGIAEALNRILERSGGNGELAPLSKEAGGVRR